MLRLATRGFLAVAVVASLLWLAWMRADFFPGATIVPAPTVDHLPLPAGTLTESAESVLPSPHESGYVVRAKPVAPAPAPGRQPAKTAPAPPVAGPASPARPLATPSGGGKPGATTAAAGAKPAKPALPPDWKTAPITRVIPGAYVVVYLSRRAVGLVVDGQYVRAYHNVGLPADFSAPRQGADGRVPIGDYFVVSHDLPQGQMKLRLSYPAPADAARMLAAGKISRQEHDAIVAAAKAKKVPESLSPVFGPPAYIAAGNRPGLVTRGDIAIGNREMDELWAAVADGAVVMIRP